MSSVFTRKQKPKTRKKKGQFFILGAILLVIMFSVGIPLIKPILTIPSEDLTFFSENIKNEYPAAFNIGLNHSNERSVMSNFTNFINKTLYDHNIGFNTLWVYTTNQSSDLSVIVGNYMGSYTQVNLSFPTQYSVNVSNGVTDNVTVSGPGSTFNLTITHGTKTKTVEWARDKANLYVYYEMSRLDNIVKEEFTF